MYRKYVYEASPSLVFVVFSLLGGGMLPSRTPVHWGAGWAGCYFGGDGVGVQWSSQQEAEAESSQRGKLLAFTF